MSTAKIDVLAVMDEAALSLRLSADRKDMREARAAVAELIEAAEADCKLSEESGIDCSRLRAALARIGGAA